MPAIEHATLHLQARVGLALNIELEALPGAGLQWQAPTAPAGCTLVAADSHTQGTGVGGPVPQRFVLACDRAAEHKLRFELKRAWQSEPRAVQTVRVTVGE